jgi:hypothetical protein
MALATTEPYFPIVLKTRDTRRGGPMNPSAFLFRVPGHLLETSIPLSLTEQI